MRFMGLLLQLLLAFAFSLHHSHAQNPPGFMSLDCGLRKIKGYNDIVTGLYYSTDDAYVANQTSEGKSISPEFITNTVPRKYLNVRSFPGPQGSRNCYSLRPLYGKGNEILLRVGFLYGNYDDQNTIPEFDLYVGVNYWITVKSISNSFIYEREMIHTPTADYVELCLVNTGQGTPFVSVIELRSIDPSRPVYNTSAGSLELFARWDLGSKRSRSYNNLVRFKDDPYDRTWEVPLYNLDPTTISSPNISKFSQNPFELPHIVMTTAEQAPAMNESLNFTFVSRNSSDQYYIYLHFAEIIANQSREMNVYVSDAHWSGPFVPPYLGAFSVFNNESISYDKYQIIINTTTKSRLPAMLNAMEVFLVKQFSSYETDQNDVAAITSIKAIYAITSNWQGDPCSPKKFAWTGINCSYNAVEPPNIISLNLSSGRLIGTIAPSISNLTMLQSLDLSYNNLTGLVPDSLSWLPSLKYLNLRGNNFTGPLPSALLEKSKNGSLTLSFETANHENSCVNDACKKKNNSVLVPVVASVASFLAILALSSLLYIILRRKPEALKVESNGENGSGIEPKLRQFTYSEVMSFIGEKKFLGGGGFGSVYLGCMNGVNVAVKVFKVSPEQQTRDFRSEVKILATVYHKNLTRIFGYCNEGVNKAIIFELIENGNLSNHLSETNPNVLSWEQRLAILIGAAEGLQYLHHGCQPAIIHRDIKPENILLTKAFEAKLADFGFSRIFPVQSSRVIGTLGYVDPQYNEPSMLTEKIDIFSFGVVMVVVITGQPAIIMGTTTHITQWITPKIKNGDIGKIIDPRLEGNYDVNVCWRIVELAMKCVSSKPSSRPNMNYVVKQLKDCLPSTQLDQHERHERRYSNDAAEITVLSSTMRSVVRPNTS